MANNENIDGILSVGGLFLNGTITGNFTTGKGSATGAANAVATLNNKAGNVGTTTLVAGAGQSTAFTITNSVVVATDIIFCTIQNSTNTGGVPGIGTVAPFGGGFTVQVVNSSTTGTSGIINGTFTIGFVVFK